MMMLHGEGSGHVQRLAVNLICREFTLLAGCYTIAWLSA